MVRLALSLMGELSACLQMITNDIACATNLEEASARWLQRVMDLKVMIESASESQSTPQRRSRYQGQITVPSSSSIANTVDLSAQSQLELSPWRSDRNAPPKHSSHHLLKLTPREREILELTEKAYPPRKIARSLQITVDTVYTHLRNARRKQRRLDALETISFPPDFNMR